MEESVNRQLDLPPETFHYDLRIGGHTHVQGKIKLGMLKHNNGNMLKPLISGDPRSLRELLFYQKIHENCESDSILNDLKHFIPSFHGIWETKIEGTDIKYLCIEDICGTFQKPCVLDVKIGSITYDHFASEEKINREKKKYPSVEIFGFRILGMKVYDHCNQEYTSTNKAFGVSLTTVEAVSAGLGRFFNNKLGQINCLILSGFLHKLLQLKSWFLKQQNFVFISSSILFVYEGNLSTWITLLNNCYMHVINSGECKQNYEQNSQDLTSLHCNDCSPIFSNSYSDQKNFCNDCYLHKDICTELQKNCTLLRISMLDFAHVFPTSEEDSNYVIGLNSFILYWQQLLKTTMETYL